MEFRDPLPRLAHQDTARGVRLHRPCHFPCDDLGGRLFDEKITSQVEDSGFAMSELPLVWLRSFLRELESNELDILLMVTVSVVVVVEIRGILSAIDAVMKARTSQGAIALIVRLLIAVTTIVRQAPTR